MKLNYLHRIETTAILIHHLTNLPFAVSPRDVESIFRWMGFYSGPHHFFISHSGEVFDNRDSRARGSYFLDSIDILLCCSGTEPTAQQTTALNPLVEALKLDYEGLDLLVRHVSPYANT